MDELINLEKIAESVRKAVKLYAQELLGLLGDNVCSIVIYGSAIGKDFIPKISNINLLVVCKQVELIDLKKCFELISRGRKKGIIAPLFLTRTHMETSSDVFPIEFLDMRDFHQVIYGEKVFDDLDIGIENLRLECEGQLKGGLIRLRQAYIEVGADPEAITAVLVDSLTSLIPVFRGMLRLLKKNVPLAKSKVISAVSEEFGANSGTLNRVLDIKGGRTKIDKDEIENFFGEYISEIEKLAIAVDQLGSPQPEQ